MTDQTYRQTFHLTPPYGFMNDIQPFYAKDGIWHIYYLWNGSHPRPEGSEWRHASTQNWLTFRDEGTIVPKYWRKRQPRQQDVATGALVRDRRNLAGFGSNALLIYATTFASGTQSTNLWYSVDEGISYTPYSGNPIQKMSSTLTIFRDPYVFIRDDIFHLLISEGQAIGVYRSSDGKSFQRTGEISHAVLGQAGIIECPMMTPMVLTNEQGVQEKYQVLCFGTYYDGGAPKEFPGTWYLVGQFNDEGFTPIGSPHRLDQGPDFYATRVGRARTKGTTGTYAMAWLSNWDYATLTPGTTFWHSMSMARSLTLARRAGEIVIDSAPIGALSEQLADVQYGLQGTATLTPSMDVSVPHRSQGTYAVSLTFNLGELTDGTIAVTMKGQDWSVQWEYLIAQQHYVVHRASDDMAGVYNFNRSYTVPLAALHDDTDGRQVSVTFYVDTTSIECFPHDHQPFSMARYGQIGSDNGLTLSANTHIPAHWHVVPVQDALTEKSGINNDADNIAEHTVERSGNST